MSDMKQDRSYHSLTRGLLTCVIIHGEVASLAHNWKTEQEAENVSVYQRSLM